MTCFIHSSSAAGQRAASRSKAGQRRRVANAKAPVNVANIAELQRHVGQALADALMHENSLKRSAVIARLILVAAKLIEVGEHAEKFRLIEARLESIERAKAWGRDESTR